MKSGPMRILTVAGLWPDSTRPNHGVFVENRLSRVQATGAANIRVLTPVPWFPFRGARWGEYAKFAAVPDRETRGGITADHPRYLMIPKIGARGQPDAVYRSLSRRARRLIREEGPFDLVDAQYFYPEGPAAARLADELDLPLVVTARGSDVSEIPLVHPFARRRILETAARAERIVTVAAALKAALVELGVEAAKIRVLRNGVDLEAFHPPGDRAQARARWGVQGEAPLLVSVGALVERKGHHLTLEALAGLPEARLLIAGSGPEKAALEERIRALGLEGRARLLGPVPHKELSSLYGAAEASILASSREGWANVLLESMACGAPAVATRVWGAPEVITAPEAGRLAPERSAESIRAAVADLLAAPPRRAATRAYAERFSWEETVSGTLEVFRDAIAARADLKAA